LKITRILFSKQHLFKISDKNIFRFLDRGKINSLVYRQAITEKSFFSARVLKVCLLKWYICAGICNNILLLQVKDRTLAREKSKEEWYGVLITR